MKEPFLGLPPPPDAVAEANEQVRYTQMMGMRGALGIYTPAEVAALLSTTEGNLKQWRYRGVGPKFVVTERRIFYRVEDLREYLAQNVVDPTDKHGLQNPMEGTKLVGRARNYNEGKYKDPEDE